MFTEDFPSAFDDQDFVAEPRHFAKTQAPAMIFPEPPAMAQQAESLFCDGYSSDVIMPLGFT